MAMYRHFAMYYDVYREKAGSKDSLERRQQNEGVDEMLSIRQSTGTETPKTS